MSDERGDFLPYNRPFIGDEEIAEVVDTLRSGWLTTGPKTRRFEGELASFCGARHALALSSGTAALHLALAARGIGPGDEVITSAMTFASCAHVITHVGATPVLADVTEDDANIDPRDIEHRLSERTKALMPVDYGGQPCRLDEILAIADSRGLFVIEDAAHSIGATYRGRPVGSIAHATALSFYATKNLATGEGGALLTDDDDLDERARVLALHGMNRDAWKRYEAGGSWFYEITDAGYKYNFTDIEAALGLAQLARLEAMQRRREELAARYDAAFRDVGEIAIDAPRPEVRHARHLYTIRIRPERLRIDRGRFIAMLSDRGIGTSVHFIPVYRHPYYERRFGFRPEAFPVTERIYQTTISLPLYPSMTDRDVDRVAAAVREIARSERA